jgi:hypothetical protein
MTAPEPDDSPTGRTPRRPFRRGRRPLVVLGAAVAGLTLAGAATGITLGALGSDGPGPGPGPGADHHRHGPAVAGQGGDRDGPGGDRLVPPDQD